MTRFVSHDEWKKMHEALERISKAYWRIWFHHPFLNHGGIRQDLAVAKKKIEELGI